MKLSDLTEELLIAYVKGQLEIQNPVEGYIYRGQIAKVSLEGNKLLAEFDWCAQGAGSTIVPNLWINAPEKRYYATTLLGCSIGNMGSGSSGGGDRICIQSRISHDVILFLPADGGKLDPAKVEGLVLPTT